MEDDKIVDCNEVALQLVNCSRRELLIGTSFYQLAPERQANGLSSAEEGKKIIQKAMEKGIHHCQWLQRTLNGRDIKVEVTLFPVTMGAKQRICCIWKNINEGNQERKYQDVGIVHDINNYLTIILGNITLAKRHMKKDQSGYNNLLEAEKASLQTKNLVHQLLENSKEVAVTKEISGIEKLIQETTHFMKNGFKIDCQIHICPDLWQVEYSPSQLSQVFNNLIINAGQSMSNRGVVQIKGENIVITKGDKTKLPPGQFVKITIMDEGMGIPVENLPKIFEPYFTTKPNGTGLGLFNVQTIIKKHGGFIGVESEVEKGTSFYIYLPAIKEHIN